MADSLLHDDSIGLFEKLYRDEPLHEFLLSQDPVWAGRIQEQEYYRSEIFRSELLPHLVEAVRDVVAQAWDDDDDEAFSRVIRVLNHVPAPELLAAVETFLDKHLAHLAAIDTDIRQGDEDPQDDLLADCVGIHLSTRCLNILPDSLQSYRSMFFAKVRSISLTCHNDFECTAAAVQVLQVAEELLLEGRDDAIRASDLKTLRRIAEEKDLQARFGAHIALIAKRCEEIQEVTPSSAITNFDDIKKLVPIEVIRQLPLTMAQRSGDQIALALFHQSVSVWNSGDNYRTSDRLLELATILPLSEEGKQFVKDQRAKLRTAWREGIRSVLSTLTAQLKKVLASASKVAQSSGMQVNTTAVDQVFLKVLDVVDSQTLRDAYCAGLDTVVRDLLSTVESLACFGSKTSCQYARQMILPLAEVSTEAGQTLMKLDALERKQNAGCAMFAAAIGVAVLLYLMIGR